MAGRCWLMRRVGPETFIKIPGAASSNGARPVLSILIPTATVLSLQVNLREKALRVGAIDTGLAQLDPACPQP